MIGQGSTLSPRSMVIATYALCGFANFSSIAIQIGGIGGMVPGRRHELSVLGLRAMIAGTLANFMTACVVGILL
jgi:CNT family concentrative nucleoside transporter